MKWRCFFKLEKWREKKRRLPVGKKKWGPESKATNFWPRVPSHKLTRQWMGQFPKISYEIHLKNQSGSIFPAILVYKKRVTLHPQVPPTVLENNEVSWFPQKIGWDRWFFSSPNWDRWYTTSRELTYPPDFRHIWVDDFPNFPRWDMWISWSVPLILRVGHPHPKAIFGDSGDSRPLNPSWKARWTGGHPLDGRFPGLVNRWEIPHL